MSTSARWLLTGFLTVLGCDHAPAGDADGGVPIDADAGPQPGSDGGAEARFALSVLGGTGSGLYQPGTNVRVFADYVPGQQVFLGWDGGGLEQSWSAVVTMPAMATTVTALVAPRPLSPAVVSWKGATAREKHALTLMPAGPPTALLLLLHGTGGSSALLKQVESLDFAAQALERGWAVVAPDAEEVVAGDLDGNGKLRWYPGLTADNVDLANLEALLQTLPTTLGVPTIAPRYVVGMSNGGSMSLALGAVGSSAVANQFPSLRFAAVASYCASGRADLPSLTNTPTFWFLATQDRNEEVGPQAIPEVQGYSAQLVARGVRTGLRLHQPVPLHPARFARVAGVSLAQSAALLAELQAAGDVGADGAVLTPLDVLSAQVKAQPARYPVLGTLPLALRLAVGDELASAYADHQFFGDEAAATLDFLEGRP